MTLNKKNREEVLLQRARRLRNIPGEKTLNAMLQLNKLNLDMCKASIREKNPRISNEDLLKELKKIYWKK